MRAVITAVLIVVGACYAFAEDTVLFRTYGHTYGETEIVNRCLEYDTQVAITVPVINVDASQNVVFSDTADNAAKLRIYDAMDSLGYFRP